VHVVEPEPVELTPAMPKEDTKKAAATCIQRFARGMLARHVVRVMQADRDAAPAPAPSADEPVPPDLTPSSTEDADEVPPMLESVSKGSSFSLSKLSKNLSLLMPEKAGSSVDSKMRALFQKCDSGGSGKLGLTGFTKALSGLRLEKHLEDYAGANTGVLEGTRKLFEDLDSDHDGLIDEAMFLTLFKKLDENVSQQLRAKGHAYKSKRGSSIQNCTRAARAAEQSSERAQHSASMHGPCSLTPPLARRPRLADEDAKHWKLEGEIHDALERLPPGK
jgi:hypothetical protein